MGVSRRQTFGRAMPSVHHAISVRAGRFGADEIASARAAWSGLQSEQPSACLLFALAASAASALPATAAPETTRTWVGAVPIG